MPSVTINFKGVGQIVSEGRYPVVLTKVTTKKNPTTGADGLTFQATIKGSDGNFEGRALFRNFSLSNDPNVDNSGIKYYLLMTLAAFGADVEELASEESDIDIVEYCADNLYGQSATAIVTHIPSRQDASKMFASVEFADEGL